MISETDRYLENRQRLIDGHAYDPSTEHDACGVGLVCAIDGKPRREVVELAIRALKNVWHRGAARSSCPAPTSARRRRHALS
jgi:glutamate synthase (NADPH/NADH) large chain